MGTDCRRASCRGSRREWPRRTLARLLAGGVEGGARGEAPPVVDCYLDRFTFAGPEFDYFGNRFAEGFQSGLVLPRVQETGGDPVAHRFYRRPCPFPRR